MPAAPEDEEREQRQAGASAGEAGIPAAGPKPGRGRPAGTWPEDLTPTLVQWLQTHPAVHSLDKAVQVGGLASTMLTLHLIRNSSHLSSYDEDIIEEGSSLILGGQMKRCQPPRLCHSSEL